MTASTKRTSSANSPDLATYGPETPWLCWDKWAQAQRYKQANPPWFRAFTSVWTDPEYRQVWEPHGDKAAALLFRLMHYLAAHSRIGAVWGDPVALQRELGMSGAARPVLAAGGRLVRLYQRCRETSA